MPTKVETPDFYIQVDTTPVDILLADLSRPRLHIYVVVDEAGRYVTTELDGASLSRNGVHDPRDNQE